MLKSWLKKVGYLEANLEEEVWNCLTKAKKNNFIWTLYPEVCNM